MRSYLVALLLILLAKIGIIGATGSSSPEDIARPKVSLSAQNVCVHLDDIHHLECQLNISRQHDTINTLRSRAGSLSETFDQKLHLLNAKTLESCAQVFMDMTEPETRSYRAQLSDWAPFIFNTPTKRFVSDGMAFLNGLEHLKRKALDLGLINVRISEYLLTLDDSCQGASEPCMGDEIFMSRVWSTLELSACENVEVLRDVTQAAVAWLKIAVDIDLITKIFGSKLVLVMHAQADGEKATEEWVANVVARWIVLLEGMLVRTGNVKASSEISTISQSSIPLPLLYESLPLEDEEL